VWSNMFEPPLHVSGDRNFGWFKVGAALKRGYKSRTLDLCLSLCAGEAMPFPAPPAG
jgi:hypothetical protein